MSTERMSMEFAEQKAQRRVTELEIKLPKLEELKLPQVNWEPVRNAAEQVLLTGIGIGVLAARGMIHIVKTAHEAGVEAAQQPGPAKSLLEWIRPAAKTPPVGKAELRRVVPVLPLDNYDQRDVADILSQLPQLNADQVRILREYELEHRARPELIEAMNQRLAAE